MNVQKERDAKNSLRFYITIPEGDVGPITLQPTLRLSILEADKLVAQIKTELAKRGAELLLQNSKMLRARAPTGSDGDTKPYVVKRPKAGKTPAHYRVGLQLTFSDPSHAAAFATAAGIS